MSITNQMNELNNVTLEIKRLSDNLRELRKTKKEIENVILEYLKEKDQPGVKFQGKAFVLESKSKRIPKKKTQKKEDAIRILENCGLNNPEKILEQLLEASKGDEEEIQKLKITKLES